MRLVVGLSCLLLAGCGGGGRPSMPEPSGSLPSVIDSSAADNPPGSIACARLAAAVAAGSFMTPGVVDGIVATSATADAPLADAAHRIVDAYAAAIAASNKADEPDKIAAVGAAASDMSGVCAQ